MSSVGIFSKAGGDDFGADDLLFVLDLEDGFRFLFFGPLSSSSSETSKSSMSADASQHAIKLVKLQTLEMAYLRPRVRGHLQLCPL